MSCLNCPLIDTDTCLGVYTFNPRKGEPSCTGSVELEDTGLDGREFSGDAASPGTVSVSSSGAPAGCGPNKTVSFVFVVIFDGLRTVVVRVIVVVVGGAPGGTLTSSLDIGSSLLESGFVSRFFALRSSAFRLRSARSWPARMSSGMGRFFAWKLGSS